MSEASNTFLDTATQDNTENGLILKKKVKEASYFGIIAVLSIAAMYYTPEGSRYLGLIPGFALGMMSCILGGAFFKYRKYKEIHDNKQTVNNSEGNNNEETK